MFLRTLLLATILFEVTLAGKECVWIIGQVQCQKDPSKNQNVEIRVYDRDSWGPLKMVDPDDLMGVTFSTDEGRFQLDGCGDDFDWIPGINNTPEPYIEIRHYCNSERGETITLPEFNTFVPNTYELKPVQLDSEPYAVPASRLQSPRVLTGNPKSPSGEDPAFSSSVLKPNL